MEMQKAAPGRLLRLVNYSIAGLFAVLGIVVLIGYPIMLPAQQRWLLGIVLLLWAVYRVVATRTKFPIV